MDAFHSCKLNMDNIEFLKKKGATVTSWEKGEITAGLS